MYFKFNSEIQSYFFLLLYLLSSFSSYIFIQSSSFLSFFCRHSLNLIFCIIFNLRLFSLISFQFYSTSFYYFKFLIKLNLQYAILLLDINTLQLPVNIFRNFAQRGMTTTIIDYCSSHFLFILFFFFNL